MILKTALGLSCLVSVCFIFCNSSAEEKKVSIPVGLSQEVLVGAERMEEYLPLIIDRKIGVVTNQTSLVKGKHLVDTLVKAGADIAVIFTPEHGFRGDADAGETVENGKDAVTGIPIVSLYGKNKKPRPEDMQGLDMVIYDIQDVGVRFYTYISTLHYVMEACAENNVDVLVLDRPNPNGHYVDGPVLKSEYKSFVGMHEVPVVYGMTVAEYAQMINEEGWLEEGKKCNLSWITCGNYSHEAAYELPVAPSPNLPNMRAVYLYPSLCFFEGTVVSVGRGTDYPFQVFGHPNLFIGSFVFTPEPRPGARQPKLEGEQCYGASLASIPADSVRAWRKINLEYLISAWKVLDSQEIRFFLENGYMDKLAGSAALREQVSQGMKEEEIRRSWQKDLQAFGEVRKKYLLYEDFTNK